jgi:hypothetical protein
MQDIDGQKFAYLDGVIIFVAILRPSPGPLLPGAGQTMQCTHDGDRIDILVVSSEAVHRSNVGSNQSSANTVSNGLATWLESRQLSSLKGGSGIGKADRVPVPGRCVKFIAKGAEFVGPFGLRMACSLLPKN